MTTKIHGIDQLIALRRDGMRPELVFVMFVDGGRLISGDVGIGPAANIERLDLRPFVGLQVLILADTYTPALRRLFERMHEFAASVVLSVKEWLPNDLGLVWGRGEQKPRPFGRPCAEAAA